MHNKLDEVIILSIRAQSYVLPHCWDLGKLTKFVIPVVLTLASRMKKYSHKYSIFAFLVQCVNVYHIVLLCSLLR